MSLNLTASGSPEKICCFPFCMMGNLHPSGRMSCHLVPCPYTALSHTAPWMLMWHFIICLFCLKRGEQKKKGPREMEEGWSICVGSCDSGVGRAACSDLGEVSHCLVTYFWGSLSCPIWDVAMGELDHVRSWINAQLRPKCLFSFQKN